VVIGSEPSGLFRVRRVNDAGSPDETSLAIRMEDGEEVAVRVYGKPVRTVRGRERFTHEVTALAVLAQSLHVLPVQDTGFTDTGHAYVVTEYCPNGSMADHLTAVGRLTPTEVRRVGAKLALTLAEAHRHGIVHRSVKPANILITGRGEPALSDFGLVALATSDGRYRPPHLVRREPYHAPEAFLPELASVSADIYSLGATLYALLAGWAPWTHDPLAVAVDGESLADLPKVPWALMSVLRQAMAADPRDRFATGDQLAAALLG
jgi:serine/threonine protein kinase